MNTLNRVRFHSVTSGIQFTQFHFTTTIEVPVSLLLILLIPIERDRLDESVEFVRLSIGMYSK